LSQDPITLPGQPGDIIAGKYQIIDLIGAGGIGFVVSAIHTELGERVALKFLRTEALANQELVYRFGREARAAVRIKSEYVARVLDVGNLPDGVPFIVMELLDGRNLGEVVRERGPLPVELAVEYMMQACEALATAHASGIVHRDIKPENLFLAERGQGLSTIKVLDFGISKFALGAAREGGFAPIRTATTLGSPIYMSPEQIRSPEDVEARTDIWSLGCVLYELLVGRAPFNGPSLTQVTAMILEQNPLPLTTLCAEAPPELEAVVMRCLAKDVRRRFQNVAELAVALYPFAPKRSRISVERCCQLLHISNPWEERDSDEPVPRSGGMRDYRTSGLSVGAPFGPSSISPAEIDTQRRSSPPAKKTPVKAVVVATLALAALVAVYFMGRAASTKGTAAPNADANPVASPTVAPSPAPPPVVVAPSSPSVAPAVDSAVRVPVIVPASTRSTVVAKPRPSDKSRPKPAASPNATSSEPDVGF
jgi:serine/threonine-protein kinase